MPILILIPGGRRSPDAPRHQTRALTWRLLFDLIRRIKLGPDRNWGMRHMQLQNWFSIGVGRAILAAGLVVGFGGDGRAQEALRSSIAGETAAAARQVERTDRPYNLKLGPVTFGLTATAEVRYNDNFNLSENDRMSDFIIRPGSRLTTYWPLTERNSLSFIVGVAYEKYLSHSERDRFVIETDTLSGLSLDFYVKDFHFNIHDRFSYSLNPVNESELSQVQEFGGFQNTAGITADWDLNDLILTAGYDHFIFISDTGASDFLNRTLHQFITRASFLVNPTLTVGPEATATLTDYEQTVRSDNTSFSAGLFGNWQVSPNLTLGARSGYVGVSYDAQPGRPATSDLTSYYIGFTVDHSVNPILRYQLSGGREVRNGINSDGLELWYARLNLNWAVLRDITVNTPFTFEHGTGSGGAGAVATESYNRYSIGLNLGYQLTQKIGTSLDYRLTLRDSDVALRDYYQHLIALRATYRF